MVSNANSSGVSENNQNGVVETNNSPESETKPGGQVFMSLKAHIMRAREKRRQEAVQDALTERHRREVENKRRQDAMTLEEIKDQLQRFDAKMQHLNDEKNQLTNQLKKLIHEDETRRREREELLAQSMAASNMAVHGSAGGAPAGAGSALGSAGLPPTGPTHSYQPYYITPLLSSSATSGTGGPGVSAASGSGSSSLLPSHVGHKLTPFSAGVPSGPGGIGTNLPHAHHGHASHLIPGGAGGSGTDRGIRSTGSLTHGLPISSSSTATGQSSSSNEYMRKSMSSSSAISGHHSSKGVHQAQQQQQPPPPLGVGSREKSPPQNIHHHQQQQQSSSASSAAAAAAYLSILPPHFKNSMYSQLGDSSELFILLIPCFMTLIHFLSMQNIPRIRFIRFITAELSRNQQPLP